MTDQSQEVFSNDQANAQAAPAATKDTSSTTTLPDDVSEFVGEGKKYATTEDALKSIPHAQTHISELERQMAEMREDLESRTRVEDLLKQMNSSQTDGKPAMEGLTPEAVQELINNQLTERERESLRSNNIKTANDEVTKRYGEKAKDVVRNKAAELGISIDDLKETAAKSPAAFLAYFNQSTSTNAPPRTPASDMQTAEVHSGVSEGSYAYFQKMRRENPTEYHKTSTQMKMHQAAKAARERGEDFYKT